jgi:RsmE family RNA methyltransferase
MGIKHIDIINSWRVDKSYWSSPLLAEDSLRAQAMLGLEQAGDTILPTVRLHRLFTSFVYGVLPGEITGRLALVADPSGEENLPAPAAPEVVLAAGPEGGFIERELTSFREIGFAKVSLGPRILRVENAVAYMLGRLRVR